VPGSFCLPLAPSRSHPPPCFSFGHSSVIFRESRFLPCPPGEKTPQKLRPFSPNCPARYLAASLFDRPPCTFQSFGAFSQSCRPLTPPFPIGCFRSRLIKSLFPNAEFSPDFKSSDFSFFFLLNWLLDSSSFLVHSFLMFTVLCPAVFPPFPSGVAFHISILGSPPLRFC